jgi:uncharacterized protein (DUF433 family)
MSAAVPCGFLGAFSSVSLRHHSVCDMISVLPDTYLNKGIYTPQQVARYARLRTQTVNRWVYGNDSGPAAIRASMPEEKGRFITFLDFTQTLALRAIRLADPQSRISLQKVRKVVDLASQMGIEYPFARRHTTWLFDDDIVLRMDDDGTLIQITGKYRNHQLMQPVIELYGEDLVYNADTGLAELYSPFEYKGNRIVFDPTRRFGEPMVEGSGYSVDALVDAAQSEGGVENASQAFGVDQDAIRAAQRFDDWLRGAA